MKWIKRIGASAACIAVFMTMSTPPAPEAMYAEQMEMQTVQIREAKVATVNTTEVKYVSRGLPRATRGTFKSYMDYRAIKDPKSNQAEIQRNAYTDESGYRRIGERYLVAMGTYYAEQVGKSFRITLSTGQVFEVTMGDVKSDSHTDEQNQYCVKDKTILEFIVDTRKISELSRKLGSMAEFPGDIIGIEEIVE